MKEVLYFLRKSNTFYTATEEGNRTAVRPFGIVTKINGRPEIVKL
jgi:uncharacterized pyridoxamine 5'-phosphate oxidase family protein